MATIPYDNGVQVRTAPSAIQNQRNFLRLGLDFTTSYDDNIWESNIRRLGGVGFLFAPAIAFNRNGPRLGLTLDYRPSLLFYGRHTELNQYNQNLGFEAKYRATERISVRFRTGFSEYSGFLQPLPESSITPGIGGPGQLNQTILTPYNQQYADDSRLDLTYRLGLRTSIGVFGSYAIHTYGQPVNSLSQPLNTEGKTGGAQYVRLLTRRMSLGVSYAYENLHVGPRFRVGLQMPAVALSVQLLPGVHLDTFGGPVYAQMQDAILIPVAPAEMFAVPISRGDWHWNAGGDVILQRPKTTIVMNVSRQVQDGGGLLTAVTNTAAGASVSRQLAPLWSLQSSVGWQRNTALPGTGLTGSFNGFLGQAGILYSLSEHLTIASGYSRQQQHGSARMPLGSTFDRNFVYFSLRYMFREIPIGR